MAGDGRNFSTLKDFFTNIEMLEQAKKLTDKMNKNVIKHVVKIQDFEWPLDKFDCIVGVWCLSYLGYKDRNDFMLNAEKSLKEGGHILLFEPVLSKNEI